ncbi:hypothetical protein IV102_24225 [bacterium]|nr:hypothetical protein [bacterium]
MDDSSWDPALDAAQVYDTSERERLRRALILASELLQQFRDRINKAVGEYRSYSAEERRLPLQIEATFHGGQGYYELERELAEKVLGPVFKSTRISMPITLTLPGQGEGPADRPSWSVTLYPVAA